MSDDAYAAVDTARREFIAAAERRAELQDVVNTWPA